MVARGESLVNKSATHIVVIEKRRKKIQKGRKGGRFVMSSKFAIIDMYLRPPDKLENLADLQFV